MGWLPHVDTFRGVLIATQRGVVAQPGQVLLHDEIRVRIVLLIAAAYRVVIRQVLLSDDRV